jgi:hypothetical protein
MSKRIVGLPIIFSFEALCHLRTNAFDEIKKLYFVINNCEPHIIGHKKRVCTRCTPFKELINITNYI